MRGPPRPNTRSTPYVGSFSSAGFSSASSTQYVGAEL